MQYRSTPFYSYDLSREIFKTDFAICSVWGEEKKKGGRFFESKVTLEKSSYIFLYQFHISHDEHKKFQFWAEWILG